MHKVRVCMLFRFRVNLLQCHIKVALELTGAWEVDHTFTWRALGL